MEFHYHNLKKKKKILFFGRVHKKKGLDLLLRVIKNLPNNYFDEFSFDITGPGLNEDVDNLKKKITEFSLEKKVKYNPPIYGDKKMAKNFQEVIASLQSEIDHSFINLEIGKPISNQVYILEQAASEMLRKVRFKKRTVNKSLAFSKSD